MTVFRPARGKSWLYDFWWRRERYTGNTWQTTHTDADLVESALKKKLRLQAGGLAPPDPTLSPTFADWADVYLEHVRTRGRARISRPDRIEHLLRVVLRFWGATPPPTARGKWAAVDGEPYHNLRLQDPITDPTWLLRFEAWMDARRWGPGKIKRPISAQTRNQYRSVLSQMYRLALRPAFRIASRVTVNPFAGVDRETGTERTSTVTLPELRRWVQYASYHVRLACAIATLAPKLRLGNILRLRWRHEIDRDLQYITVHQHKTARSTRRPLVVPITDQLRKILEDARRRTPSSRYVVTYRGGPVKDIGEAVQAAAIAARLPWGRYKTNGVTFHTIRHSMATALAEMSDAEGAGAISESVRKAVFGHQRLDTTQRYTHIRPLIERQVLARLSAAMPIADLVTAPRARAVRPIGRSTGTRVEAAAKTRGKTTKPRGSKKRAKPRG